MYVEPIFVYYISLNVGGHFEVQIVSNFPHQLNFKFPEKNCSEGVVSGKRQVHAIYLNGVAKCFEGSSNE